jgi:hypothetical protein
MGTPLVRRVGMLGLEHPTDLDPALGAVLAGVDPGKLLERARLARSAASSIDVTWRIR